MTNNTHTRDLARALSRTTDLTYQQAHQRVVSARTRGHLPSVLDAAGMSTALSVLQSAATPVSAPGSTPTPAARESGAATPSMVTRPDEAGSDHPVPARRGFVLVVGTHKTSASGSAVTVNLAAHLGLRLKEAGKTVALIDTYVADTTVGRFLNQDHSTVVDIARSDTPMAEAVATALVHRPDLNLAAVLGPERLDMASPLYINSRLYRDIITELKRSYDYIVVNATCADMYHDVFANFVIPEMDFLAMVTLPERQQALNVDQFLRVLAHDRRDGGYDVGRDRIGLVEAPGFVTAEDVSAEDVLDEWQRLGRITGSAAWHRALDERKLVAGVGYADLDYAFDTILGHITGEAACNRTPVGTAAA